jgi:signal peptidase
VTDWGTLARRAGRISSGTALGVALITAVLLVAPALLGYQRYAIVTGSMTGTYDPGALVIDQVVPVGDLRVGDVITYLPPRQAGIGHLVTHRIAAIGRGPGGTRVYRTKGDANPVADPWHFTLPGRTQARVALGVPHAGRVLLALSDRHARVWLLGLPAALLALSSLGRLWRRLGEEARAVAAVA